MSTSDSLNVYDSGRNHLVPAIVAVVIAAAFIIATLVFAGPPH